MFSASWDRPGGSAFAESPSRITIRMEILGSPLLRMKSMRSSLDIWLSDFCTSRTLTTARVSDSISPSLPAAGTPSCITVLMNALERGISFCSITA